MSKWTVLLCAAVYLTAYNSIALASDLPYVPGEVLVRFAAKSDGKQRTISEKNDVLAVINGGTVKRSYKFVKGLTLVKLPTDCTVENALSNFKKAEGILYAEPNYKLRFASTFPNDTRFNELWAMHNMGQTGGTENADIDAPEAWDISTRSAIAAPRV